VAAFDPMEKIGGFSESAANHYLFVLGTLTAAGLPGECGTREVEEFQVSGFKSSLTQRR
jgi:hypothetical protein